MQLVRSQLSFQHINTRIGWLFQTDGEKVDVGQWQSQAIPDSPFNKTLEIQGVSLEYDIPQTIRDLQADVVPSMPWAEDHFQERVSGIPMNPPPSHEWWPYARKSNDEHRVQEKFSHTYPERIWPKRAIRGDLTEWDFETMLGIRYEYGDLGDVVEMLLANPLTRQAFLPIWFPEDTGNAAVRLPCTLGYHFMVRKGRVHITYYMRSCDYMRHFRDDVYMACRLAQWMTKQLQAQHALQVGTLTMHVASMHIFQGADEYNLRKQLENG